MIILYLFGILASILVILAGLGNLLVLAEILGAILSFIFKLFLRK